MARRRDSFLDILILLPWWVSVVLAIGAYLGLAVILPAFHPQNPFLRGLALAGPHVAPIVAAIFGVTGLISAIRRHSRRRLLQGVDSIEAVRRLSWRDFERLVGEFFRRRGYSVYERGLGGADGGVDLELRRGTETILVQCKHWKSWKVGVRPVRELFGVIAAEGASSGIFVTSGHYTREAREFARANKITLINGHDLVEMIQTVSDTPLISARLTPAHLDTRGPAARCDRRGRITSRGRTDRRPKT